MRPRVILYSINGFHTQANYNKNSKKPPQLISGELISRLEDLGREDAVLVLLSGCSLYRILTVEESMMSPNSQNQFEKEKSDLDQVAAAATASASINEESVS